MTAPAVAVTKRAPAAPPVARTLTHRQRLELLHSQLTLERSSFISHWKDINQVLFPRRGRFTITDANKGDRRNKNIIDATATFAARTLASGMMSGITSPAREWFRLTTSDADIADQADVKEWLHNTTADMFAILAKSNFYDVIHMVYGDLGVYGTAPFLTDDDDEDVIRCYPFPVGSYTIANDAKLRVRTFTREWQMTVRQLVEQFGYYSCSTAVQNAWNAGSTEQWVSVVHVITSNALYDTGALGAKYKPFTSCYFEKGSNEGTGLLRESGYDEFPVFVARWECTAEDVYATECPGMLALGDINQLQFSEKRALEGIDKQVRPPLVAPSTLKNFPISQLPGGVTFDDMDAKSGVRPLFEVKPDLAGLEAKQEEVRNRIRQTFYADLFLMLSYMDDSPGRGRQPVTATEIAERKEEKLLALGPMLNRLDKGVFGPFIDRLFQIMKRRGLLRPAPQALQNADLRVEYISVLHAAQKAGGLQQIERFADFVTGYFDKTEDPSVLDSVDVDEMISTYHDQSGVPPKLLRSADAIAQIRGNRQQQQQAAASAAQLKTTGQGAKALSDADTSGKNALTDVLAAVNAGGG